MRKMGKKMDKETEGTKAKCQDFPSGSGRMVYVKLNFLQIAIIKSGQNIFQSNYLKALEKKH